MSEEQNQSTSVEVKEFVETDRCKFCEAIQGGYVAKDGYKNLTDNYLQIRDGHNCNSCGKAESPL